MTMTGTGHEPSSIQTRPSLLNRLKEGDDVESWQEFYRVYGKLARDFAIKAGLTDTEADEVVQETDRKSTRLNSSHTVISYAVFCLKKKKKKKKDRTRKYKIKRKKNKKKKKNISKINGMKGN